jgi:hypothetical protein
MRWAFWVCLSIFIVVLLIVGGTRLAQGLPLPEHWSTRPSQFLTLFLVLVFGMSIVIYAIGWIWGAGLKGQTLTAATFWGRRVEVPLSSVTDIESISIEGLPALLVKSSATKSNLHILTLGLNTTEVYNRLCETAGPAHPLTIWFARRDA